MVIEKDKRNIRKSFLLTSSGSVTIIEFIF